MDTFYFAHSIWTLPREKIWNLIGTRNYIDKIWNQYKNVYEKVAYCNHILVKELISIQHE